MRLLHREAISLRLVGAIIAIVLALAFASCALDTPPDQLGAHAIDLCAIFVVVAIAFTILARPGQCGRPPDDPRAFRYDASLPRLDPPPRLVATS